MNSVFLKDSAHIKAFCKNIKQNEKFITIDTEFYRKSSYFAELCLLQIGTSKEVAFLDPKEEEDIATNWKPFFEILTDKSIQKVFHAPFEDLEILFHLMGNSVSNIFDTQIAAAFLNFGLSASYQTLTHAFLGKELNKTAQQTDWRQRPLTEEQITYAAEDVLYLREIYEICLKDLEEKGRLSWALEEMAYWEKKETFTSFVSQTYKKLAQELPPEKEPLLYALLSWREEMAKGHNISRKRILTEEDMIFLIKFKKGEAFFSALSKKVPSQVPIQEVQEYIYAIDPSSIPELPLRRSRPTQEEKGLYELLKLLLQEVSKEEGIASTLIASREEMVSFAQEQNQKEVSFLKGWRKEIFGEKALALREGKLAAFYQNKQMQFLERNI